MSIVSTTPVDPELGSELTPKGSGFNGMGPLRALALLVSTFLFWGIGGSSATMAQGWDAFPRLAQSRVSAIGKGVDKGPLGDLESCLRGVESAVGADYFAAIVRVSDPRGRDSPEFGDAVPYADALYQHWRSNRRLDPETHILVVLALANRTIAIHPGSRWADLGFEARHITRVIDGSRFGDYARGGDFDRAICALVADVDRELARLVAEEQKRRDELATHIDQAQGLLAELPALVTAFAEQLPVQASSLVESIQEAASKFSLARRSLERGRQADARNHLKAGRQVFDSIHRRLKRDRRVLEALEDRARELHEIEQRVGEDGRAEDPLYAEPLKSMDSCRSTVNRARAELQSGKTVAGDAGEGCLSKIRSAVAAADLSYSFWRSFVPLTIRGGLFVLVIGFFVYLFLRRRSAQRRAQEDIERWRSKLGHAAERLLQLEQHHPLYFSPEGRRWSGESRALDQACADAVNRVYVLYGQAMQLLDHAEELVESGGWLRAGRYLEAFKLLRETEITFDVESPQRGKDHRRIFLPMSQPYQGTALELLDDLDGSYGAARDKLDEVAAIEARHRDLDEKVDQAAEHALAACRHRADLQMPTRDAMAAIDPLLLEKKRVGLELMDDPVAAIALLEDLLGQLEAWAERLVLGNETLTELRGTITKLGATIRARIDELRADDFRLEEPGFQPDLRLDRGLGQADDIERAVADGREEEARGLLDTLFYSLVELEEQLAAIAGAREGIPVELSRLEGEVKGLRERLPGAQRILDELHREHALDAFEVEADNLTELESLLDELERWRSHIHEDHRVQHYLSALEDLETCRQLVTDGRSLLSEVDQARSALEASRRRCREIARELGEALAELAEWKARPGVAPSDFEAAARLEQEGRDLLEQTGLDRPNWPRLEADIDGRLAAAQRVVEAMQAQHALYLEAMTLFGAIETRLGELDRDVRADDRDRPHVAQAVADAERALTEWRNGLEAPGLTPVGAALLDSARELDDKVAWATGIWRTELDLIHMAESELAAAKALYRQEDGRHHGHGVVADCSDARHELRAAQESRSRRAWESVLERSRLASEAARREAQRCRREADEREEEERRRIAARRAAEAAERRRREQARRAAAAAAAAAASASSWSSSQTSSSSFGRSAPRSRSSSSSSRSSSRSSRSSFGSRSGSSSFHGGGSSRSGGSRW